MMWTEPGMGAGRGQQEGKGSVPWVHNKETPEPFGVLESRKDNSEGSPLLCPEWWPDQEIHPFTVLGGTLSRQTLCYWVLLISKVQYDH